MPVAMQTKIQYLLTGGEVLTKHASQDSHGSCTTHWQHDDKDGKNLRYFGDLFMSEVDKSYLEALKKREIKFEIDNITNRGYVAILPDGREINSTMVSFTKNHPELVKHDLNYLLFPTRETALKLLKNEKFVVEYRPKEENKLKKNQP